MKKLLPLVFLALSTAAYADGPFYSQPRFGLSMVNPAFTGSWACGRAEMGYRLQWPGISASYQTFNAAYDQYFKFGGVGVNYTHDAAARMIFTDRIDLNYAVPIGLWKNDEGKARVVVQPGIQCSYERTEIDWTKLNFGDMIDPRRGFVYGPTEAPATWVQHKFDLSAGLLVFTNRIAAGAAVFHLTQPDEGFLGSSKLPMRYVMHASGVIGSLDTEGKHWRVVPSVIYMKQQDSDQLMVMATTSYDKYSLGVGMRTQDALIFSAGFRCGHMAVGYSYDLTISGLTNETGGSHEIHLGYRFMTEKWSNSRTNLQLFN